MLLTADCISVRDAMHSLADFRIQCVFSDWTFPPEMVLSCREHNVCSPSAIRFSSHAFAVCCPHVDSASDVHNCASAAECAGFDPSDAMVCLAGG